MRYNQFIHSPVIFVTITKVGNYEPPTRSLLRSSLHHFFHEVILYLQSAQNLLISYPVLPTYLQRPSVASHLKSIHFLAHRLIPCPTHIHNLILRIQNSSVSSSLS